MKQEIPANTSECTHCGKPIAKGQCCHHTKKGSYRMTQEEKSGITSLAVNGVINIEEYLNQVIQILRVASEN